MLKKGHTCTCVWQASTNISSAINQPEETDSEDIIAHLIGRTNVKVKACVGTAQVLLSILSWENN